MLKTICYQISKYLVSVLLLSVMFLFFSCQNDGSDAYDSLATPAKLERIANFQSKYVPSRNIDVWLPSGYNAEKRYPVLYMHDGQMLFDSTQNWNKQEWGVDEVAADLIRQGVVEPFIVVGVWNAGTRRHSEYFPQKPFQSLHGDVRDSLKAEARRNENNPLFSDGVRSDDYLSFLVNTLKPHIDENYATNPNPEHTFIAGSSMGH